MRRIGKHNPTPVAKAVDQVLAKQLADMMDAGDKADAQRVLEAVTDGDAETANELLEAWRVKRTKWEFLQRVSAWVYGATDEELDKIAGV